MRRVLVFLVSLALTTVALAQSADQTVSATDSPDPVVPGNSITYSITVTNNGPDPAANGGVNILLDGNLTPTSVTPPAGFTCTALSQIMTCNTPSFTPSSGVVTLVALVSSSLLNFPDGTLSTTFTTSGVTPDPNNGNNSTTVTTAYDSPQVDLWVAVSDSPDPVFPDGNITYTATAANAGPDAASNVNFNLYNSGTLRFQSATAPAGWNCTLPAVGSTPTFTCNNPSFAGSTNAVFTIVVQADDAILGINDGMVSTVFGVSGTGNDTNTANNTETENTAYVTPDANMGLAVTDSPDPVAPDGNITYTATVTNAGPDTAPNAMFSLFNNGSLRFQSATVPAGWNCTLPAVGSAPTFSCSNPSFANGGNSVFTIVVQADDAILGINDGTVSTAFGVSSGAADPNNANNAETEDTAYVTPDADLSVTNTDSPDPVSPGGTITYTQMVANAGPDTPPVTTVSQVLPASVGFQSLSAPAGFTCTTPAVGASGTISCTHNSFASGASGTFTLVVTVLASSGTVTETVQISSGIQDPDSLDNAAQAITTILAPLTADLGITKSTGATAVGPGQNLTYTITLTNNGPDSASNVVMTDVLPSELLFQSISTPAGFSCTTPAVGATGTITCNAATLANGVTATFTLVVQTTLTAIGPINNTATATSSTNDGNPGNDSGGSAPVVVTEADLSINKSTAATEAMTGSTITYTITVSNGGPDPATNVVVNDDLPAGLQLVSATPSQGSCSGTDPFSCNLGTINNAASATINVVVLVTASTGTVANTATVTSATTDTDPTDNSSSTPPIPVTPAAPAAGIPTLSEWMLFLLIGLLGVVGVVRMR